MAVKNQTSPACITIGLIGMLAGTRTEDESTCANVQSRVSLGGPHSRLQKPEVEEALIQRKSNLHKRSSSSP